MLQKGLVSVISPCYNGETYIRYFLDSLLIQDYRPFEVFIVDDGSTDNTYNIAKEYESRFLELNINYTVLRQENQGAATAINQALPLINGEFLTWPDSDDILYYNNISEKVKALNNKKKALVVMCETDLVNEVDRDKVIGKLRRLQINNSRLFYDFISCNNNYFAPIGYMISTEFLFTIYVDKQITSTNTINVGQNWQILLPVMYTKKMVYLKKSLGKYVIRDSSHSRTKNDIANDIHRLDCISKLFENLISVIPFYNEKEKNKYEKFYTKCIFQWKLEKYFSLNNKAVFNDFYKQIPPEKLNKNSILLYNRINDKKYNEKYLRNIERRNKLISKIVMILRSR